MCIEKYTVEGKVQKNTNMAKSFNPKMTKTRITYKYSWTDNEAKLLLKVTLEYKTITWTIK